MNPPAEILTGKVAIVTGAAGDIGSGIATALLDAGSSVVWVGRRKKLLEDCIRRLRKGRDRSLVVSADVRKEAQIRQVVRAALGHFGKIDILVNNAGARGPTAAVTDLSLKDWQEVIDTNLTAPFLLARECLRHMARRREGCIINISSTAAHWAYPLRASYAASKAGLLNLTLTLAQEAGEFNITVNAICPGPTAGRALDRMFENRARTLGISFARMQRDFMRPSAMGRKVTPEDMGRMALFLVSDAANNITGQVIDVSAGYGLYPAV